MKPNRANPADTLLSVERLKMAMEVAADGIWDWRIDTNEMFFDSRYYTMAGYSPDEFPAGFEEWEKRVHPDDYAATIVLLKDFLKGRAEEFFADFRYRTKENTWIWIRGRGKIFERDPDGNPTRMIGTHTDITELKQAETVRQQSEENYRLFVENAHDGILILQGGVMRYANPSIERILGYARDELSVFPFSELIHPDDRRMVMERHKHRLAGLDVPNYYSFRVRNRSGEERLLELNAVRIEWLAAPAVLGFLRDITHMKKMEQQLIQSQKMQAIGTLAGGIAHDFNNILSAVMGYTELSQMIVPAGSKIAGHLEQVLQAGRRARDLVSQILAFSRQEETDRKPVQVHRVVKEALKLLRASIPATIEFRKTLSPDTGFVMADPTRIHQIIMNLASNAAHAMRTSGGILEISLANYDIEDRGERHPAGLKAGAYIRLTVSDTGDGVDPETVQRIFDPYFTTKKKGEGTGLGLSVVHGIVTAMQGTVKVYSEPGEGTAFQVYLPRADADPFLTQQTENRLPKGEETILLVDDEASVLEMTAELLEALGYTVVPRTSSREAYHAFCASPDRFDLVITDQTMPKLTGIELAEKIGEIRTGIPVILCSGFSAGITRKRARGKRIHAVLNKPVLNREMAAVIRNVLDRRAAGPFQETKAG